METSACGSIARSFSFSMISLWIAGVPRSSGELPAVRHRNKAPAVHRLVGQGDEIAGAAAGVDRNEQAAPLRLEEGDLNGVADADHDLRRRPVPGAEVRSSDRARGRRSAAARSG